MESGLKNLLFRKRSRSKPAAVEGTSQDSFRQTSSYAAVSSGPAPKFGALPLKPSKDTQPRKSFAHRKAKSDGLQESLRVAESANIGRPRTSPNVKPYFVGVSKPDGSALSPVSSSRVASVATAAAEGKAPPPVPSLPEHLDSLQGPRYYDIMQFAARQQISRATFNEHIANRNMGLPRKSVDIFETEASQLSGRTYNEYVAMRNIDLVRQSIDGFEDDVARHDGVLPDTRSTSFDVMRASIEGLHHQSGGNGEKTTPNKTPGQGMADAKTDINTHVVRAGQGEPVKTRSGAQLSGSDTAGKANADRLQRSQSSKVGSHSRQHSWKQNNRPRELSSIPQSRTADFMPLEWLNHGNTAISSDGRTRSMTAAIAPRLQNAGTRDHASAHHPGNEKSRSLAQTVWDTRDQLSQHGTSRSLSVLEGSSRLEPFRPKTSVGQQVVAAERSALRGRPSLRSDDTRTARSAQDMPQAYPRPDTPSHPLSMGMSVASSTRKRVDISGRTIMDLTDDRAHRYNRNASHSIYYELPGELQQGFIYDTKQLSPSPSPPDPSNTHTPDQYIVHEINTLESLRSLGLISSRVGVMNGHQNPRIQSSRKAPSDAGSTPAVGDKSEQATSGSKSRLTRVSDAIDSQLASFHNQVTVPLQPLASKYLHDQAADQDCDITKSRQLEHVYSTPESLKSNDFTDPSRAFGVTARDFAVSPIHKQSQGTQNRKSQPQDDPELDKLPPFLTTRNPTKQDKIMHHVSSFTFPSNPTRTRQLARDQIAFDEDAFKRKQSEARIALLKLERDLQENFDFAFDSLNVSSAQGPSVHFRNLSMEAGEPIAPISRFSSVHTPTAVYQNRSNNSVSQSDSSVSERSPLRQPFNEGVATANSISTPSAYTAPRGKNRNSVISNTSEIKAEQSWFLDSAPAPTIPLSFANDRGRTMMSRQPVHARMHSTASTGSGFSAFSVPPQLIPERTSSIRDSDVPPFHIGDAGWE